jgi:hypothetical protein
MERIRNKEIRVEYSLYGWMGLSYLADSGQGYHKLLMGYNVREAKKIFKEFVRSEEDKKL